MNIKEFIVNNVCLHFFNVEISCNLSKCLLVRYETIIISDATDKNSNIIITQLVITFLICLKKETSQYLS